MQSDPFMSPRPKRLEIKSKKQYKYKRSYGADPSVFVGDPVRPMSNRKQQTDKSLVLAIEDIDAVRLPELKQAITATNSSMKSHQDKARHNHSRSMNPAQLYEAQYGADDDYQQYDQYRHEMAMDSQTEYEDDYKSIRYEVSRKNEAASKIPIEDNEQIMQDFKLKDSLLNSEIKELRHQLEESADSRNEIQRLKKQLRSKEK